jgi:hypothetical protein
MIFNLFIKKWQLERRRIVRTNGRISNSLRSLPSHLLPERQKMITSADRLTVVKVAEDDPHYSVAQI